MASRKLTDLAPSVAMAANAFEVLCRLDRIDLLIYCTYRSAEEQTRLYAIGRNGDAGAILTNATQGKSFHQYRVAIDVAPMLSGKPVWSEQGGGAEIWRRVGAVGESLGFEWSWKWRSFRELGHFQISAGAPVVKLMEMSPREIDLTVREWLAKNGFSERIYDNQKLQTKTGE